MHSRDTRFMGGHARRGVGLVAMVVIVAATVAGATVWLLVAERIGDADVISTAFTTGDVGPFVRAVGAVIVETLRWLLGYL
jgi:hypothetical protein